MLIHWNLNPTLVHFNLGPIPIEIRYYGILLALGFYCCHTILKNLFPKEGVSIDVLQTMTNASFWAVLIGARAGHVFFYEMDRFLRDPLMFFKIFEGGLASHGWVIGFFVAFFFLRKKYSQLSTLWMMDRVSLVVPLAAGLVRLGNLTNSEILGKPTDGTWGVIFDRIDQIPRHPAMLYEAIVYFGIFAFQMLSYRHYREKLPRGYATGSLITIAFVFRIIVEFWKENQSAFEATLPINMGQILSIPFIGIGLFFWIRSFSISFDSKHPSKRK